MRPENDDRALAFALPKFAIRRSGRAWHGPELADRLGRLGDCKVEVIEGRLFGDEYQRRLLLGMLLENVGLDAAVGLAEPILWRQALEAAHQAPRHRPNRR